MPPTLPQPLLLRRFTSLSICSCKKTQMHQPWLIYEDDRRAPAVQTNAPASLAGQGRASPTVPVWGSSGGIWKSWPCRSGFQPERVCTCNKLQAGADLGERGPFLRTQENTYGDFWTKGSRQYETIILKLGASFLNANHFSLMILILFNKDTQNSRYLGNGLILHMLSCLTSGNLTGDWGLLCSLWS